MYSSFCLGMHRNENSWPKPNKMKHWAEYRTRFFTFISPVIIYIIIIVLLFILQNNSKITILTFMNVDGALILAGTRRKTSVLLFVDNSMQIFLRYISLRIWEDVCHTYHIVTQKKEQMINNSVSALWTLNPGAASSCSTV